MMNPIRSCSATPQKIVFHETFRRLLESSQAIAAKIMKPTADTA
jgi:hypothetical protein